MIKCTYGHKKVYSVTSFMPNGEYPIFHGKLYFSSIEKIKEFCTWKLTELDIIAEECKPLEFDDMDFVPDNY
jgi:hypothetical protein